jgi:hypothetical protein
MVVVVLTLTIAGLNLAGKYFSAVPSRLLAQLSFRRFLTDQSSTLRLAASRLTRILAMTWFEIWSSRDEVVQ